MTRLDWPALMRAGLHHLALTPRDFWVLTPAELQVMLGVQQGRAPMTRSTLDALEAAYPDLRKDT